MEGESKIRKIIFNEVTLIIAIVGCVSGVIFWIINPQSALEIKIIRLEAQVENNEIVATKLQNIKDNDLHELQLKLDQIESRQIEQLKILARLETLLK